MNPDIFQRVNRQLIVRGGAPPRGGLLQNLGRRDNNFRLARVYHRHNRVNQEEPPRPPIKREVRAERVVEDSKILSYTGGAAGEEAQVGVYIAANPITPANPYFEVEILDTGILGAIGVGLVPPRYELNRQPGWMVDSIGYHADDGRLFKGTSRAGRQFGPRCYSGDRIGCGVRFEPMDAGGGGGGGGGAARAAAADPAAPPVPPPPGNAAKDLVPVFFTRNGKEIGRVLSHVPAEGWYPCVGMHSEGEEVRLHLDAQWEHSDVILMSIDNHEEEWARLHDVRINGQLLEYTGRGKSIIDVGLAQARYPLNTTNHYYEIKIVDPGESCYIAIGLARRDYPKHRHPGWNKGSIAYHADDGKIFNGSGAGDNFGPKCQKGDIMGCGILFPRDYNPDAVDSDGSRDSPDVSDNDDYLAINDYMRGRNVGGGGHQAGAASSDSEDERWWERAHITNSGTLVQVFFTNNGKTIGKREVRIPKGGFYPTVGMLSSDEKVLVDLRPLTG